jgi:hypothetical protein
MFSIARHLDILKGMASSLKWSQHRAHLISLSLTLPGLQSCIFTENDTRISQQQWKNTEYVLIFCVYLASSLYLVIIIYIAKIIIFTQWESMWFWRHESFLLFPLMSTSTAIFCKYLITIKSSDWLLCVKEFTTDLRICTHILRVYVYM